MFRTAHRSVPACGVVLLALLLLAAGGRTAAAQAATPFAAHGSIGQAYVQDATPGTKLTLLDRAGRTVASAHADRLGSLVFHDVRPGPGYTVRAGTRRTPRFAVLRAGENPPAAFYRGKVLKPGLNYVRVRDGIELAMTVRLPTGRDLSEGPFPTLVEYSGYQVAAPHDLLQSVLGSLGGTKPPPDPLAPVTGTAIGSIVGPLLDFAVVSVQMRGSGCSGGALDMFDLPTIYDGYDAIETVARQPWVKGGTVGMAGISFSGITQLLTAGTRPPHLSAIAPMSVTDDLYATLYPGGILNTGFAKTWITERLSDAQPAPKGGQPYAQALTEAGDAHCRANQRLRLQTPDLLALVRDNPSRTPAVFDHRSIAHWIDRVNVPTFLVGSLQDEQTGGHFPESLAKLAHNPRTWITLQNGVHVDSLGPSSVTRWIEFLNLYVADRVPAVPPIILALSGELYRFLADAGALPIAPSRFEGRSITVADAKREFERDPRVRLLMDSGGSTAGLGSMGAPWHIDANAWPVPVTRPATWYLAGGGALAEAKPKAATARYTGDPSARPAKTLPGTGQADAWKAQPPYDWTPVAAGKGLGWTAPALTRDVVLAGPSSLDVELTSSARDTDLQATITEVRPDGNETYVQNGWLRASHRALDPHRSTAVDPVPTYLPQDVAPLPAGRPTLVRVPILPATHAFRAGSRIRVTLTAPGGDRPRWHFATIERGRTTNTIALGGARPSRLVLSTLPDETARGTPLPGPTALRGEPNRSYRPATNGG